MVNYDGEECSSFIRQVRRKAFEAGKSRDKEWMADYAVSCFAEDALKWSVGVPPNVLEDWDTLQRALMEEYCKYRIPSVGLSGAAATPAAAPAASPGITLPTNVSTVTGYIRIVAETSEAGDYISKTVDSRFGMFLTCTELALAARVRLMPLMTCYGVQLVDFPEPYCWLGIFLVSGLEEGDRVGPETRGNLCPTSAPSSHVMGTSSKGYVGPARSNIWLFQTLDSCITNVWSDSDSTYVLQPLINLENKRILAVSNCRKYSAMWPGNKYTKARLIFEPA
ncbi:hypothetical protein FRC04_007291 [Tulasnella sp. 424]|nr:hypothetical protein FRC04_007291 [Tulasnella sp. 424]KAG8976219.1 hypothetical protein FRC05_004469 [Tulasnella sp. 425]